MPFIEGPSKELVALLQESDPAPPVGVKAIETELEAQPGLSESGCHVCQSVKSRRCSCFRISCAITTFTVVVPAAVHYFIGPCVARYAIASSVLLMNMLSISDIGNSSLATAMDFTISNVAPLGCSTDALQTTIMYEDRPFGLLQMPSLMINAAQENTYSVKGQVLHITDLQVWSEVSTAMMRSVTVTWRLKAQASITTKLMGTSIRFTGVPFDKEVQVSGFTGFVDPSSGSSKMAVLGLDVLGGQNGILNMMADCEVINPSNIAIALGPIKLELWTTGRDEVRLGELILDDFALQANQEGTAVTRFSQIQISYTPPSGTDRAVATGRSVLSRFIQGISQKITVRGATDGSGTYSSLWKPSIAAFSTSTVLPGLVQTRLVLQGWMGLPSLSSPYSLPTTLLVKNPFNVALLLKESHCDVFLCNRFETATKCSEFAKDSVGSYTPSAVNEMIPGKAQIKLKTHPVLLNTLFSSAGLNALSGSLIRFTGSMSFAVEDMVLTIDYEQNDVPVSLR